MMPKGNSSPIPNFNHVPIILALIFGLSLSILAFVYIDGEDMYNVEVSFQLDAKELIKAVEREKEANFELLKSLKAFYLSSEFVTRTEFNEFTRFGLARHTDVQALEWAPYVRSDERHLYEEKARSEGFAGFSFTEISESGDLVRAAERKEYMPVYYMNPYKGNERAMGFDLLSETERARVANKTWHTGEISATKRIILLQEDGKEYGYSIFIPVYKKEMPDDAIESRHEYIKGFALGVFKVSTLISEAVSVMPDSEIVAEMDIDVYDITEPSRKEFLYCFASELLGGVDKLEGIHVEADCEFRVEEIIKIADRKWVIDLRPKPSYISKRRTHLPILVLFVGLAITTLLVLYFYTSQRRSAHIELLAKDLSKEINFHKSAEKTLKVSEENYREIFNSANDAIFVHEINTGKILDVNNKCSKMFGYSKDEMSRLSVGDISENKPPYTQDEAIEWMKKAAAGEPQIFEWKSKNKSGDIIWVEVNLKDVVLEEKKRIVAVVRDISDRKKVEEALQNLNRELVTERDKLESIVKGVGAGLSLIGSDCKLIWANDILQKWFGPINEIIYKFCYDIYDIKDSQDDCLTVRAIQTGSSTQGEVFAYTAGGDRRCYQILATPIKDDNGQVSQVLEVIIDITERKKAEEILRRDKDTFEALVEKRTKLLMNAREELAKTKHLSDIGTLAATVAHELRNPLAAIQLAAYNIKRKRQVLSIDKHVSNIEKKVQESDQIINNLLGYSRIKMPRYGDVNLHNTLEECIDILERRNHDQAIKVVKNYEDVRERVIRADSVQLKEIFNNILTNSFQAISNKNGIVEISTSYDPAGFVRIGIKDNGAGISKEDIDKVFDAFFTKKSKGTGLGLTICKELINLHGGDIKLRSKKGTGTTITITLPVKGGKNEKNKDLNG